MQIPRSTACDKVDIILIDGSSVAKAISSDCGLISIEVTTFNGQYFFIKQNYELTKEINVYPDSLIIEFNGSHLPFTLIGSEKINNESEIILSGKGSLKIDFEVNQTVHKGDTIKILM